jgi:hypothetical protein
MLSLLHEQADRPVAGGLAYGDHIAWVRRWQGRHSPDALGRDAEWLTAGGRLSDLVALSASLGGSAAQL